MDIYNFIDKVLLWKFINGFRHRRDVIYKYSSPRDRGKQSETADVNNSDKTWSLTRNYTKIFKYFVIGHKYR